MRLLIDVNNNKLSQPVNCQLFCVLITDLVDKCWPLADFPSPLALSILSWLPSSHYLWVYPWGMKMPLSVCLGGIKSEYWCKNPTHHAYQSQTEMISEVICCGGLLLPVWLLLLARVSGIWPYVKRTRPFEVTSSITHTPLGCSAPQPQGQTLPVGFTCDRMFPPVGGIRVDEPFPNLPELVLLNDAIWFLGGIPAQVQGVGPGGCDPRGQDALRDSLGSSDSHLKHGVKRPLSQGCTRYAHPWECPFCFK